MKNQLNLVRKILPLAVILFAISGILDITDSKKYDFSGFRSDTVSKTIIQMDKDSPTEKVRPQLGDFVMKSDWVIIDDSKELNGYQQTLVGKTRVYEMERSGIPQAKKMTFAPRSAKDIILDYFAYLLGFPEHRLVAE